MIKAFIISILWVIIMPAIIGYSLLLLFKREEKSFSMALIVGLIIEYALYEAIAEPCIFLGKSFTTLTSIWFWIVIAMLIILFGLVLLFRRDEGFELILDTFGSLHSFVTPALYVFIIMFAFQAYHGFFYMYEDADDSNFVAKANISITTNTLFKYDDNGDEFDAFPTRQVFSPFPVYTATIAQISDIHPTILAHTIFPVLFLFIAYNVYYLLGKSIFKNDKYKITTFLAIFAILIQFSNYSRFAATYRILVRLWQGKSILVNVMMPFIIYLFIEHIGKKGQWFYWVLLCFTLWASLLLSSMAFTLPIIEVGLLTILFAIKDKKPWYVLTLVLCLIPSIAYGLVYLNIK